MSKQEDSLSRVLGCFSDSNREWKMEPTRCPPYTIPGCNHRSSKNTADHTSPAQTSEVVNVEGGKNPGTGVDSLMGGCFDCHTINPRCAGQVVIGPKKHKLYSPWDLGSVSIVFNFEMFVCGRFITETEQANLKLLIATRRRML